MIFFQINIEDVVEYLLETKLKLDSKISKLHSRHYY